MGTVHELTLQSADKRQVIDITDNVAAYVPESGEGMLTVFTHHTTAAITTADLDPGTDQDYIDFFEAITPRLNWRHPHDPAHAPDHLLASLIGPSVAVPYKDGRLSLGTWQRVILVEFDGPRSRTVSVVCL